MHSLVHWMSSVGTVLAVIITLGAGILIYCCLSCSSCGCKDNDDLFRRKSA